MNWLKHLIKKYFTGIDVKRLNKIKEEYTLLSTEDLKLVRNNLKARTPMSSEINTGFMTIMSTLYLPIIIFYFGQSLTVVTKSNINDLSFMLSDLFTVFKVLCLMVLCVSILFLMGKSRSYHFNLRLNIVEDILAERESSE